MTYENIVLFLKLLASAVALLIIVQLLYWGPLRGVPDVPFNMAVERGVK